MIIAFNGDPGSGKSTIAKKVAQQIGYPRYYMGQIFRNMAKKRGMTLVEYLKLGEIDPNVDKEVDDYLVGLSKKEDHFVIESRTAWHLIPNSVKLYLKVDEEEGARRIFEHLKDEADKRNEDRKISSVQDVLRSNRKRVATDDMRYQKYYGIDIHKESNYDFVLDTTNIPIESVFQKVMEFLNSKIGKNKS